MVIDIISDAIMVVDVAVSVAVTVAVADADAGAERRHELREKGPLRKVAVVLAARLDKGAQPRRARHLRTAWLVPAVARAASAAAGPRTEGATAAAPPSARPPSRDAILTEMD